MHPERSSIDNIFTFPFHINSREILQTVKELREEPAKTWEGNDFYNREEGVAEKVLVQIVGGLFHKTCQYIVDAVKDGSEIKESRTLKYIRLTFPDLRPIPLSLDNKYATLVAQVFKVYDVTVEIGIGKDKKSLFTAKWKVGGVFDQKISEYLVRKTENNSLAS